MRPSIARRPTKCDYCKEAIEVGTDRLDDVIKTPKFYRRIHYHPTCYQNKIQAWYEINRDKVPTYAHGGGRPPSDLSPEDKVARTKILVKLSNLVQYYLPKLNLQAAVSSLSTNELRQFNNFNLRFREFAELLAPLGGLPPRYQSMGVPPEVIGEIDKPVSENSVAVITS